jgi:hypothetical protein
VSAQVRKPYRHPLFQVFVLKDEKHWKRGMVTRPLPIGPKCGLSVVEMLCEEVKKAIKSGKITGWHDPVILPADEPELTFPRFGNDPGNLRKLVDVAKGGTTDEYRAMREGGTSVIIRGLANAENSKGP